MKLWIARDKDGELCLYKTKPWKRVNTIYHNDEFDCDDSFMNIDIDLFPEITFENSPQEIELRLEKENIVKILKTYDNIFGLSDGGIARSDEDIEYAADVILKSLKESNS